jgi:hypothetical protein
MTALERCDHCDRELYKARLQVPPPITSMAIADYCMGPRTEDCVKATRARVKELIARLPHEAKLPDTDGWWARIGHDGSSEITWFKVRMTSDSGDPPLEPHIYVGDLGQLVSAKQFRSHRWFGPVLISRDDQ